jgi:hypothetical protein
VNVAATHLTYREGIMRASGAGWAACVVVAAACGGQTRGDNPFESGSADGPGSAGTDSGVADGTGEVDDGPGGTANVDEGGSGDPSDGEKLDVGFDTDGPSPTCQEGEDCGGCTAVDILFVIDNSTSMRSYQQALAAAAPEFADAIFASLPAGTDIHVGVTTSSFFGGSGGTSPGETNCSPYYEGAGLTGRDDLYQWYWTPDAMPYAENGAQGRLRQHEGLAYFAASSVDDPTALKNWLVGNIDAVGESGSVWEMVAAGAAYPFHAANAMHNDGFLRDEGAVLAIFALTDEVDNSPEAVDVYHDMIVAAKQGCGGDACIVTGGVMKPCLATAPDNVLYPLLSSFGKEPVVADIGPELDDCFDDCDDGDATHCNLVQPAVTCQELYDGAATSQYAEALGGALAQVIAETCDEIEPEG